MKKRLYNLFSLVLILALVFTLASCSLIEKLFPSEPEPECPPHIDENDDGACDICDREMDDPDPDPIPEPDEGPDLSEISFSDFTVTYDGAEHSLSIDGELPEGVTVEYVGNGKTDAGVYTVEAKFFYEDAELTENKLTATLTINKATYDMSGVRLLSVTKMYDGVEVVPAISGTLPVGVSVAYTIKNSLGETVDKMLAAGEYTVYATFTSDNANYYPIDPISATVTIREFPKDDLKFEDLTVIYDGKPHTITVVGELPEGITVAYEGGDKIAVGTYEVTARFYLGENELAEERLTATLTIVKATVDMSGVSVRDGSAEYNGKAHTPSVEGTLPDGIGVEYSYTDAIGNTVDEIVNAGVYKITATFIYNSDCYNEINPMSFTYTVTKAGYDVSGMYPASLTKAYDGVAVKPLLKGDIPADVEVVYTYTDASGNETAEIVAVGEYTVVASFIYDETNYDELAPITFVYTVTKGSYDMSGVTLESVTKAYDGKAFEVSIGTLPEGLDATVVIKDSLGATVAEILNVGTYTVTVSFSGDFDNYYVVNDLTATVTVERAAITTIEFSDKVFAYDGKEKSIFVTGAPEWMSVTYTGNGVSAPGTYKVIATFAENSNYYPVAPMEAKIIIEIDESYPTDGIIFEEYQDGYAVIGVAEGTSIVVIPSTYLNKPVLSIKSFAFDGNTDLEYVYVPSSVINIGNRAFADCTSLSSIKFGDIKVIGQQAFKNTAIKEISLPASLESIGFAAFEGTELEKITLPFVGGSRHSSSAYFGFIFGGSTYSANASKVPETLKTVVISNGCTEIPSRAFFGLTSLTEIVLGHTVKTIGISAFQGCSGLRSIYIPETVTSIPAATKAENGPFYGTSDEMMIVIESVNSIGAWGQYFAHIADGKTALVVYGKTYDDYVINKESFRVADPTDATLSLIFVNGKLLDGFDSAVYEYTLDSDINVALPDISAIAAAYGATVIVEQASAGNGNIATITVVSLNGENTIVYKVKFNVTGSFTSSAEVVNKDGAKGTVTFVVDDGYVPTASFMKSMMEKYNKLAVTYALKSKTLLGTSDEYTTIDGLIVDDIDNDGMLEYVLDENGKYTYIRNEESIDFWRDIISVGNSEIVAHSHTHAFWGVNDEGGAQYTAGATRIYSTLPEGSATKEVYGSLQIIKDIFGETSRGITYVNAGIPPKEGDTVVTESVDVYLSKQTVRVLKDTTVTLKDGKVYLAELTWVNLQSTVGTLPANTVITTTADISTGVIPADTPIYLSSAYVTVPTVDHNGNENIVKGFKAYIMDVYASALADGTIIGARTSGVKVYNASDFLDVENRLYRKAYIITTTTNEARPESWKDHIDNAIKADGGWASFCIHAMTEDIAEEGQGGHKITWEQAEDLFSYACGKGEDLWIATQTDATLYYHQWSTSTVTTTIGEAGDEITVSLTDKEDDSLYDMALTVKVAIPGNWQSATVDGKELVIRTNDDGSQFVYVDVAPETTISIIGK